MKNNNPMKILMIGFLVLAGWSAPCTYIYVCKIKGLCNDREAIRIDTISVKKAYTADTLPNVLANKPDVSPENLMIYFEFDKSEFNSDAVKAGYLEESNKYLDQNSQSKLSITGHTDAIGSDEYNQALGYRRAQSVQKYFESKGIPATKIIVDSRGEKEPADVNNTTSGRAKNRRTVITIKK
jgi:outer membrane protein OmpA-like peptidoglycan-associated protein